MHTFQLDAAVAFPRSSRMHLQRPATFLIPTFVCATVLAAAAQGGPIPLVQGTQVGRAMFEPGDTPQGGNGQPVDGIEGTQTVASPRSQGNHRRMSRGSPKSTRCDAERTERC